MHPHTAELLLHLDQNRDLLRDALEATPRAARERGPGPDRWSVANVLEHLTIVERQVAGLLRRALRSAMAAGPLPPDPSRVAILPTLDAARLIDRERRLQAGPAVQPGGMTADAAWHTLGHTRATLRDVLTSADGLATDDIRAPHPFLGELSFHQWVAFVGFHEARHAAQIRAVAAALSG